MSKAICGFDSPSPEQRSCPQDVALGVSIDDDAMFVGKIAARTVMDVTSPAVRARNRNGAGVEPRELTAITSSRT